VAAVGGVRAPSTLAAVRLHRVLASLAAIALVSTAPFVGADAGASAPSARRAERCPAARPVQPATGPSASLAVVQSGTGSRPEVAMVRYPRPERESGGTNPWSQWGQGLVLRDGRFVSAMGDHRGADGNSYLFVLDPADGKLTRFADILSQVDHQPGAWGYGKVHAQIVPGPCGEAYVATYWGSRTDLTYTDGYDGDLLFRLDPADLSLQSLGVPVPKHGIPSMASLGKNGLLYGEATLPVAADPAREHDQGAFFVYDQRRDRMVFRSDDPEHSEFRNVLLDREGRAYLAGEGGELLVYEPGSETLRAHEQRLPGGGALRASTVPARDGTVYGVTENPDRFFALSPDGTVRSLGTPRGYTASVALADDGSSFFYVPGAHGDAFEQGTPLIAVDTETGEQTIVAELNGLAEEHLGLTLGGSYSVAVADDGRSVYVGLNAGKERDDPWGEVVLAVVTLPS
jgi:hypothetical protein